MKIVVDMQGVQTDSRHRGIGRYTRQVTSAFLTMASARHHVQFMFNAALDGIDESIEMWPSGTGKPSWSTYGPIRQTSSSNPDNAWRRDAAERLMSHALDTSGADVAWQSSVVEGFTDDALAPSGMISPLCVATLYDLIPLHAPEEMGRSRMRDWYFRRIASLKRCDLLLAISEWVRQDAIERLGVPAERVVAIGAGVDARFRPAPPDGSAQTALRERFGIRGAFVLYNGGFDQRKNVDVLFPAFAELPRDVRDSHQLVIVGRLDEGTRQRFAAHMERTGLHAHEVILTDFVSDDELVLLYQHCDLFVFPSQREGFGLPPLEAMACGAPTIANNATSLPEVIGDASALFDGSSAQAITKAMLDVLTSTERQHDMREAGLRRAAMFTWDNVAERALVAIEHAMAGRRPRERIDQTPLTHIAPIHALDALNVSHRLPEVRRWPGPIHWSGPYPTADALPPADRYRVHGYAGLVRPPDMDDWRVLLAGLGPIVVAPTDTIDWTSVATHPLIRQRLVEDAIATNEAPHLGDDDLARIADALDRLRPATARRWLVDVTQIAEADFGTGIQRVARCILENWLARPPEHVRIEPVVFRDGRYHHAHAYACALLGVPTPADLPDDIVAVTGNETFVGLDWAINSLPASAPLLRTWRRAGVDMHFIVHDLLPITLPDAFHPHTRTSFVEWLANAADLADVLHCNSRSTALDLEHWLAARHDASRPRVTIFPLGVTPMRTMKKTTIPPYVADALRARPSFLMVGTLEPRKGHAQALSAMEILWAEGVDANLVIVGKRGWLVNDLIERLDRHTARGGRLFWLDECDDAMLDTIYTASTALLAASWGEGFGLPLIEAAQRGKPVIARDLPVFREVADAYPAYFDADTPRQLATFLKGWLTSPPPSGTLPPWPEWATSAQALATDILRQRGVIQEQPSQVVSP
ncbi:MAG: Mannosylfructose-phosphate synthase [Luteibacter sp.]|uniref:glycosyltransferase family 4 protein n=1 Tax=Luteibacter sp. TaxID=1886636 RepID=UPI0013827657|nr:glycosyltransferase family 1 protein [Luteibacter sp.]KAF1008023.1 MAG: Mannosylfructose-phosphate synthase [Luteibacter sp.]